MSVEGERMIDGFVFKTYNNIPIFIDRYSDNSRLRALAVDAVRHPNRPRSKASLSVYVSDMATLRERTDDLLRSYEDRGIRVPNREEYDED